MPTDQKSEGRAFAKFETRFQLSWAVAGVIPVLLTFPGRAAFLVIGLIGVVAGVLYIQGSRLRSRGRSPASVPRRRAVRGGPPTGRARRSRPGSAEHSGGQEAH